MSGSGCFCMRISRIRRSDRVIFTSPTGRHWCMVRFDLRILISYYWVVSHWLNETLHEALLEPSTGRRLQKCQAPRKHVLNAPMTSPPYPFVLCVSEQAPWFKSPRILSYLKPSPRLSVEIHSSPLIVFCKKGTQNTPAVLDWRFSCPSRQRTVYGWWMSLCHLRWPERILLSCHSIKTQ